MAIKLFPKLLLITSFTMFSSALIAPSYADSELDFSHSKAADEIYNYEQYLYDPKAQKSEDLYTDGYASGGNGYNQENFDYGRDRYYGQERPYPNRPLCPYNDGKGHHRPHPNCPEFAHGGEYPDYADPNYPNYGHHPRPPRPPRPPVMPPGANPDYYPGPNPNFARSIRACIAYERPDGTYSKDFPITVDLLDGLVLANQYRLYVDGGINDLFVVFNTQNQRYPTILPLNHRKSLSTAATVLTDLQGQNWRISRTWKRCSN